MDRWTPHCTDGRICATLGGKTVCSTFAALCRATGLGNRARAWRPPYLPAWVPQYRREVEIHTFILSAHLASAGPVNFPERFQDLFNRILNGPKHMVFPKWKRTFEKSWIMTVTVFWAPDGIVEFHLYTCLTSLTKWVVAAVLLCFVFPFLLFFFFSFSPSHHWWKRNLRLRGEWLSQNQSC